MTFEGWLALVGCLLLVMTLSSAWVRRLPVSTAALYLGIGVLLSPWLLDLVRIDLENRSRILERLTELAVVLSLFIGGLRLRLSWTDRAWRAAFRLATLVMVASIAAVAWIGWSFLHIDPAIALLIAAILAPTDPVLASSVTVGHAQDRDQLRYALSGEAGLNDGAAFPFVVLALSWLALSATREYLVEWFWKDVLWASAAGLAIGYALGRVVGRAAILLRAKQRDTAAPTDFLVLALISLSYVAAQTVGAWGFLAVFAAGLGLRQAELRTVQSDPHPDVAVEKATQHPPAETLVTAQAVTEAELEAPAVAAGVLVAEVFSFGDTVERVLEVLLVVTVGIALGSYFSWMGVILAASLMFVVRPIATVLCLLGTPTTQTQRLLIGWFGIRGIGSMYYLTYAIVHGLPQGVLHEVAAICISAVATSILLHGVSAQPLMEWYERRQSSGEGREARS